MNTLGRKINHQRLQKDYSLVYTENAWSNVLFLKRGNNRKTDFQSPKWSMTAPCMPWRFPSHAIIWCFVTTSYETLYNRTPIRHFPIWEHYMTGAIWQKTIFNIVMALSTLPELHLIILYLSTYFFFLKSNSPKPFFQGVISCQYI